MKKIVLTIPVYNEEEVLEKNIQKLRKFLKKNFKYSYLIVIADNASADKTREIGEKLAKQFKDVDYFFIPKKGRGFALKESWNKYKADVYSFMDADLSTNLGVFPKLIEAILDGNDLAIGTRLSKKSRVTRKTYREVISRGYNLLLKAVFHNKFNDSQCGFKAVSKKIVKEIIPKIKENEWFFDTELLIKSEKKGYKIKEIPIIWIESERKSKVRIFKTSFNYLKNIIKLRKELK